MFTYTLRTMEMTQHIRVPDTVYDEAERLKEERDFPSIGEAVRYMCREGGYDV